ncbi:MAG TPA: site-2 protease family protein, partial [Thermodesulfobacteriota bacterium]|nr:site-2 protease family protein [Thermodesulfobacteriota bacterium]
MKFRNFWSTRRREVSSWTEGAANHPFPVYPPPKPGKVWNIVLFLLTLATTILAGALQEGVNPLKSPEEIYKGIPFSFALMCILLAHELGHYLMAKKHGMNVTLPYFIPAPSFIGTFGAFIKMRSPAKDRRMLLDIGAAGPLVGVMVSIPFLILGLRLSQVKLIDGQAGTALGDSLLLFLISRLVIGPMPTGYDIVIHPVGFAGWIGL